MEVRTRRRVAYRPVFWKSLGFNRKKVLMQLLGFYVDYIVKLGRILTTAEKSFKNTWN
jgi:hypothetical protein